MPVAKTTRPSVTGAVTRPRLFRLLGRREARPVTWVWGPPGAGKTTLVASFLASRKVRTLWYQVDASDADVATFFYYLAQAAPRRSTPLPPLTPESGAAVRAFARRYFRELYARLRAPFVLVLDNYHEIPSDALLHEVLREAIEELPLGGRVIAISRAAPPASLARLRVHQAFDVVDWTQLRLTLSEASQMAAKFARHGIPATDVRRLHELTDGWIAGLVLMLTQREARRLPSPADAPEVLFDYFAGEIFDRADPRTQHVLLRTAFLPTIGPDSASEVTGEPDAGAIVADLYRSGYFTNRGATPEAGYQYHPLYRAFLQARAAATYSADTLCEIQTRAAAIAERAGEVEAAARLLRSAGHFSGLADLINRRVPELLAQGRIETVEAWLAWMPDEMLAASPWLVCWRSVCQLGRNHEMCRRDSEAALTAFRQSGDLDGALLAWSTIVTSYLMQGTLEPLDVWIDALDDLLREIPGRMSPPVEARVAPAMLLAIFYRRPSHPAGADWAERALAATRRHPDLLLRAVAAFGWVFYQWAAGDATRAHMVVDEMRSLQAREDVSPMVALYASVPVLWHEFLSGASSFRATLAAALESANANGLGDHALVGSILAAGALAATSSGDHAVSRACLEKLASRLEQFGGTYGVVYHAVAIRQAMADGAPDRAHLSVRALQRCGYSTGFPLERVAAHGTIAWMFCEQHDLAAAARHAEETVSAARAMRTAFAEWMASLIEAHVFFSCEQNEEGMRALRSAMALGSAGGYVNSQLWFPPVMARLCARALDAGIEVDYVRDLVIRRRLFADPPPLDVDAWPWSIRIFTRGRLSVVVNDRPLVWNGKLPKKSIALLESLVAKGPSGARDESLMDELWPDAEGDAARRALATAVFRLRRMLGRDDSVLRVDGTTRLDPAHCWVDVWAADRLLDKAQAVADRDCGAEWVGWVERAASLYQVTGTHASIQTGTGRLRRRLSRELLRLGRHFETSGDCGKAVETLSHVVALDPHSSEARAALDRLRHSDSLDANVHVTETGERF